jgi:hypothetical protein
MILIAIDDIGIFSMKASPQMALVRFVAIFISVATIIGIGTLLMNICIISSPISDNNHTNNMAMTSHNDKDCCISDSTSSDNNDYVWPLSSWFMSWYMKYNVNERVQQYEDRVIALEAELTRVHAAYTTTLYNANQCQLHLRDAYHNMTISNKERNEAIVAVTRLRGELDECGVRVADGNHARHHHEVLLAIERDHRLTCTSSLTLTQSQLIQCNRARGGGGAGAGADGGSGVDGGNDGNNDNDNEDGSNSGISSVYLSLLSIISSLLHRVT